MRNNRCAKRCLDLPARARFRLSVPHDNRRVRDERWHFLSLSSQGRMPLTGIIPDLNCGIVCQQHTSRSAWLQGLGGFYSLLSEGGSLIARMLSAASCILQHSAPSHSLGPFRANGFRLVKPVVCRLRLARLRCSLSSGSVFGAHASRFYALKAQSDEARHLRNWIHFFSPDI